VLKRAVLGTSPGAPGDPQPCSACAGHFLDLPDNWLLGRQSRWVMGWGLALRCMRTTLDEALAFPLPLRWSPSSWRPVSPMEIKHQPVLDPVGPWRTPPRSLSLGSSQDPDRPSFLTILTSAGCHCIHAKMCGCGAGPAVPF
jgi:hypothetical protein